MKRLLKVIIVSLWIFCKLDMIRVTRIKYDSIGSHKKSEFEAHFPAAPFLSQCLRLLLLGAQTLENQVP